MTYGERIYSIVDKNEMIGGTTYYNLKHNDSQTHLRLKHEAKDDTWFMHREWPSSAWDEVNVVYDRIGHK